MEFLRILEGIRNPFLTFIFTIFTEAAGEAVLLGVLCVVFWCVSKKTAYVMGFAFMGAQMAVNNLKLMFRIDRPWILDPSFKPVESAIKGASGYSFPSGHTCAATSIYGTIGSRLKGVGYKIAALVLIFGVMMSRMYLGVHTPLDVCVAFLVTAVIVIICVLAEAKITFNDKIRIAVSILFGLLVIASIIFASVLVSNGTVEAANASDSCKMAGAAFAFIISWYLETKYIHFNERGCGLLLQIVKVVIGVAVILGLRIGLKALFTLGGGDEPLVLGGVRYCVMVFFAMTVYPIIINKFFVKEKA